MSTKSEPVLPLGDEAFWDTRRAEDERTEIKKVAESGVLLQSLRQSRENWLHKTFLKFSSKVRGNKDPPPPPHTIQSRGTCDLAIGPHIFPNTVFYEVHYLPPAGHQPSSFSTQPLAANTYWQPTPPAPSMSQNVSTPNSNLAPVNRSVDGTASSSLDTIPSSISLTPSLIQQVNFAASSNPTLANLLQLAAAGKASHDQLQTLGLLIQSFANLESLQAAGTSSNPVFPPTPAPFSYYQRPVVPPVKEFDFVLEFHETPNERWIFPRVPVYTERQPAPESPNDLNVSMLARVPFNQQTSTSEEPGPVQYQVAFILKKAPYTIWETIWRWVGGEEKNKANKAQIENSVSPPRLYLGHQLAPGPLLAQFQAAATPQYTMKALKQGSTSQTRPSRAKRTRKGPESAATGISTTKPAAATSEVLVKRARTGHAKPAPPIQCVSCKNGDVPLILGGKYCRPCAEIEKQKTAAFERPLAPTSAELVQTPLNPTDNPAPNG